MTAAWIVLGCAAYACGWIGLSLLLNSHFGPPRDEVDAAVYAAAGMAWPATIAALLILSAMRSVCVAAFAIVRRLRGGRQR